MFKITAPYNLKGSIMTTVMASPVTATPAPTIQVVPPPQSTANQFGGFSSYAAWFNSKFQNVASHYVDLKDRFNQTLALFNLQTQNTIRSQIKALATQFQVNFPNIKDFNDPNFSICQAQFAYLSDILIDTTMQRQLDISWVIKILVNFRPWQAQPIQVYQVAPGHLNGELSYLGNNLYASWDGQHTAMAFYIIAVMILGQDPKTVKVPVVIYSVKSKAEIRQNFLESNTPEGKKLLDPIDIYQQKIYGVRVDGATNPDWIQCEQKQTILAQAGLFLTDDKFKDTHHVGAISRVKEIADAKVSVDLVRKFAVYSQVVLGLNPRPVNTKELPIILGFLKMAESANVVYTDDELQSLAVLCDQLFSADFDSDGPFWARLEYAYNNWWNNYYANVHISMRPAQPRMNKDWIQGGTFFWHQLAKSWKDANGNAMRLPQLNISSPFIPAIGDLF